MNLGNLRCAGLCVVVGLEAAVVSLWSFNASIRSEPEVGCRRLNHIVMQHGALGNKFTIKKSINTNSVFICCKHRCCDFSGKHAKKRNLKLSKL